MCPHDRKKFACGHIVVSTKALWCPPGAIANHQKRPLDEIPGVTFSKETLIDEGNCKACLQSELTALSYETYPALQSGDHVAVTDRVRELKITIHKLGESGY